MTRFSARMERIREELIRRAQVERRGNTQTTPDAEAEAVERGQHQQQQQQHHHLHHHHHHHQQPEVQQNSSPGACTTRLAAMFSRPAAALLSRSGESTAESGSPQVPVVESPKSPRPEQESEWPSAQSRLHAHAHTPQSELLHRPEPAALAISSTNTGETPNQSQSSRRCRRRKRSKRALQAKRFLFCFPWVQSRRVRSAAVYCFTSGLFLVLLLAVCKPTSHAAYLHTQTKLTNQQTSVSQQPNTSPTAN